MQLPHAGHVKSKSHCAYTSTWMCACVLCVCVFECTFQLACSVTRCQRQKLDCHYASLHNGKLYNFNILLHFALWDRRSRFSHWTHYDAFPTAALTEPAKSTANSFKLSSDYSIYQPFNSFITHTTICMTQAELSYDKKSFCWPEINAADKFIQIKLNLFKEQ